MKIIRASVIGFCMGVRRAVETAEKSLSENPTQRKIFTLGPLIHNPSVLSSLEAKGLRILSASDIDETDENSTVIIRAHGTTPEILEKLSQQKAEIKDATCPRVHLSQKRAADFHRDGYQIIIAGDRNHGEVVSISSYTQNTATVIENRSEAEKIELSAKSMLIAQTTFSPDEFKEIERTLTARNPDLVVFNSICSSTMQRQSALKELEGKCDGILVIGGKTSANTRRLFESARKLCGMTALIENENEIPEEFLALGTVGITAGASTPDNVINNVENCLLKK